MKETLTKKIPCYGHPVVRTILLDSKLTNKEKSQQIHDYAFKYESLVTDHKPKYVLTAGAIEQILVGIDELG